jgi:hypothetical protein
MFNLKFKIMRHIQQSGELYGKHVTLTQISKKAAQKLFEAGKEVYLQSSNMTPFGVWQSVCPIELNQEELKSNIEHFEWCKSKGYESKGYDPTAAGQFHERVANFRWYNCDNERGRYVTYYKVI